MLKMRHGITTKSLNAGNQQDPASLQRLFQELETSQSSNLPFLGAFTDGGIDSAHSLPCSIWIDNIFQEDRYRCYCSERNNNVHIIGMLMTGETAKELRQAEMEEDESRKYLTDKIIACMTVNLEQHLIHAQEEGLECWDQCNKLLLEEKIRLKETLRLGLMSSAQLSTVFVQQIGEVFQAEKSNLLCGNEEELQQLMVKGQSAMVSAESAPHKVSPYHLPARVGNGTDFVSRGVCWALHKHAKNQSTVASIKTITGDQLSDSATPVNTFMVFAVYLPYAAKDFTPAMVYKDRPFQVLTCSSVCTAWQYCKDLKDVLAVCEAGVDGRQLKISCAVADYSGMSIEFEPIQFPVGEKGIVIEPILWHRFWFDPETIEFAEMPRPKSPDPKVPPMEFSGSHFEDLRASDADLLQNAIAIAYGWSSEDADVLPPDKQFTRERFDYPLRHPRAANAVMIKLIDCVELEGEGQDDESDVDMSSIGINSVLLRGHHARLPSGLGLATS